MLRTPLKSDIVCIPSEIWKAIVIRCDSRAATRLLRACKFVHASVGLLDLINCVVRNSVERGIPRRKAVRDLLFLGSTLCRPDIASTMSSAKIVPAWVSGKVYECGDYVVHDAIFYICVVHHMSNALSSPLHTPPLWCVARKGSHWW